MKFRLLLIKDGLRVRRRRQAVGVSRRPADIGIDVAEQNPHAPFIQGGILPPSRNGNAIPAAVAGACLRKHDRIASIGKKLRHGLGNDTGVNAA